MRSPPLARGCCPAGDFADPVRVVRDAPSRGATDGVFPRAQAYLCVAGLLAAMSGCALQEIRGKSSFGPEFRHQGKTNTSEIRYDARQGIELRWDKGWTTGMTYRRRDIDNGSGDNENLFLFEVGYPIWKAPAKTDKTVERIGDLQRQVEELRSRLAATPDPPSNSSVASIAESP